RELLGEPSLRCLTELLGTIAKTQIDVDFVQKNFQALFGEDQFKNRVRPTFQCTGMGARVGIYSIDAETIVRNPLRTAWGSRRVHDAGEIELGVPLELEDDPMSGQQFLALHVLDRSLERVDIEKLRGRKVERG